MWKIQGTAKALSALSRQLINSYTGTYYQYTLILNQTMSPYRVIITIAAYFAILFTVSYIAGRKADNAGFFVGNRKSSLVCGWHLQ